ncbi:enhanced serine sensitivity protein SseB C-terminal domain-containing protein [Acinetobacter sp. YH01005]|uniref:enhanced serine sensitivity protein SseB C-terminal domain-containing protein n=1 Tax=Acinetobacter sp. YH01005 TaxID=2601021 RepID=UPI0015D0E331|nr:enhanced serine sensitivity protein SseB C-terminal domain-containing protein [Acinetobacter sp. YH01005]
MEQINEEIKEEILEQLFHKALHEPAYRPEFLAQLLAAKVYCVGTTGGRDSRIAEDLILDEGDSVQLKSWEDETYDCVIPFFTSLEKMRLAISEEESYIRLPTKALFEMTMGARLVLNPQSPDATKDFVPEEIQHLLNGQYIQPSENYEVTEDTEVLIGQPAEYPQFMIDQLSIFFGTERVVKAAYLAQMLNQARDDSPTLLIGLDLEAGLSEQQIQDLHSKIGRITQDSLKEQCPVDLIHVNPHSVDGVEGYLLNETQAFYQRVDGKPKGFFARLFS